MRIRSWFHTADCANFNPRSCVFSVNVYFKTNQTTDGDGIVNKIIIQVNYIREFLYSHFSGVIKRLIYTRSDTINVLQRRPAKCKYTAGFLFKILLKALCRVIGKDKFYHKIGTKINHILTNKKFARIPEKPPMECVRCFKSA